MNRDRIREFNLKCRAKKARGRQKQMMGVRITNWKIKSWCDSRHTLTQQRERVGGGGAAPKAIKISLEQYPARPFKEQQKANWGPLPSHQRAASGQPRLLHKTVLLAREVFFLYIYFNYQLKLLTQLWGEKKSCVITHGLILTSSGNYRDRMH